MKKFFALLCIFLLLCGCSSHTGEISEISESSEASSAAGEPEPEAGSTAEEKPDVYLDPDGRLRFGNIELEYQDSIWILAYIDDAIYYRWQDRDDRQKVTIYKADLKSQKITEIGTIERYRISTNPIDVKLIDNHLFFTVTLDENGKNFKSHLFSIDRATDQLHQYEGEPLSYPLVYHRAYGGKLYSLRKRAVDGSGSACIDVFDPVENTEEMLIVQRTDIMAFAVAGDTIYTLGKSSQNHWELAAYDLNGTPLRRFDMADVEEDMGDYMICQTEVANDYFLISNLGQMKVLHLQEDGLLPAADGWGITFHTASYVDPLLPEKIFLYNGWGEDFFFHSAEGTFTSLDLPVVKNKETQRVVSAYQDGDSVLLAVGDSVAGKNYYYIMPVEEMETYAVRQEQIENGETLFFTEEERPEIIYVDPPA